MAPQRSPEELERLRKKNEANLEWYYKRAEMMGVDLSPPRAPAPVKLSESELKHREGIRSEDIEWARKNYPELVPHLESVSVEETNPRAALLSSAIEQLPQVHRDMFVRMLVRGINTQSITPKGLRPVAANLAAAFAKMDEKDAKTTSRRLSDAFDDILLTRITTNQLSRLLGSHEVNDPHKIVKMVLDARRAGTMTDEAVFETSFIAERPGHEYKASEVFQRIIDARRKGVLSDGDLSRLDRLVWDAMGNSNTDAGYVAMPIVEALESGVFKHDTLGILFRPLMETQRLARHHAYLPCTIVSGVRRALESNSLSHATLRRMGPILDAGLEKGMHSSFLLHTLAEALEAGRIDDATVRKTLPHLDRYVKSGKNHDTLNVALSVGLKSEVLNDKTLLGYMKMFRSLPPKWTPEKLIDHAEEAHKKGVSPESVLHYQRRLIKLRSQPVSRNVMQLNRTQKRRK